MIARPRGSPCTAREEHDSPLADSAANRIARRPSEPDTGALKRIVRQHFRDAIRSVAPARDETDEHVLGNALQADVPQLVALVRAEPRSRGRLVDHRASRLPRVVHESCGLDLRSEIMRLGPQRVSIAPPGAK